MTYIYKAILVMVIIFITMELFKQEKFLPKVTATMALIPFILRLFAIG